MKVPLVYPKIPDSRNCPLKQCVAFEKLDGTNLHWVWEKKWVKFGTRRDQFDYEGDGPKKFYEAHKNLVSAHYRFDQTLAGRLQEFFFSKKEYSDSRVIVFTEFYGPNSFAGSHENETKKVTIIDVQVNDKLLIPTQYLSDFSKFPHANVIYKGKYSGQLIEDIRNGKYKVAEGAVIKGVYDNEVYMLKVKTNKYLERLKESFKDNWEEYWE